MGRLQLTWPNDREIGLTSKNTRETHAEREHRITGFRRDQVKFAGIHARLDGRVNFFPGGDGGFSFSFSWVASLLEALSPAGSAFWLAGSSFCSAMISSPPRCSLEGESVFISTGTRWESEMVDGRWGVRMSREPLDLLPGGMAGLARIGWERLK